MSDKAAPDSLVTLHYRVALSDGTEIISTFDQTPATLQLGGGELAPTLEACVAGLPVGERHVFLLEPGQAFGPHKGELVRRVARQTLPQGLEPELHGMIEFGAPDGNKFSGMVKELNDESVLVDFNHPLAGKHLRFEVEVIGIL